MNIKEFLKSLFNLPEIDANGTKRWYLNGQELTEQEFIKRTSPQRTITIDGKEIKISEESFQELKKSLGD